MSTKLKLIAIAAVIGLLATVHIFDKRNAVAEARRDIRTEQLIQGYIAQNEVNDFNIKLLNSSLEANKKKDDELKTIRSQYGSLLNSVSNRPKREDSNTPGNPSTCTGAELSREDAGFLAGEAAAAERILKERDYYYGEYERARRELDSLKKSAS